MVILNIKTLEGEDLCIQLTKQGFRIIGNKFDVVDADLPKQESFETIYCLLDKHSARYRQAFGMSLASKLSSIIK